MSNSSHLILSLTLLLGFTLSVLGIGFITYVFGSIIFEVNMYIFAKKILNIDLQEYFVHKDHPFKTSANFHDF